MTANVEDEMGMTDPALREQIARMLRMAASIGDIYEIYPMADAVIGYAEQVREACMREAQLIAQGYESNAAAVGAFETPREMAARRCYDRLRDLPLPVPKPVSE